MPRSPILWATIAAMTAIPSLSLAADFQEARHKFCIRSSACTLNFAGPGTGQRLRIDHITCRLKYVAVPPGGQWLVSLFDGTHALYLPMNLGLLQLKNDTLYRTVVGSAPTTFFSGGQGFKITSSNGQRINADLSCTIKGQI